MSISNCESKGQNAVLKEEGIDTLWFRKRINRNFRSPFLGEGTPNLQRQRLPERGPEAADRRRQQEVLPGEVKARRRGTARSPALTHAPASRPRLPPLSPRLHTC